MYDLHKNLGEIR